MTAIKYYVCVRCTSDSRHEASSVATVEIESPKPSARAFGKLLDAGEADLTGATITNLNEGESLATYHGVHYRDSAGRMCSARAK